jgi:large subunit ribosomal protein L10
VIVLPSQKNLEKKKSIVAELAKEFQSTLVGILAEYKGINVADDTFLRKQLREAGIKYKVVKNTILKRALKNAQILNLDNFLFGTTVVAIDSNGYSNAAKVLCNFSKNHNFYKIKAGFVEGRAVDAEEIKLLAKLPPKDQLISQVLGGLNTPIVSFVSVLNATPRALTIVLSKIAEQKAA